MQYGDPPAGGSMTTEDAIPIFAAFLQQMGLGDGTMDLDAAANDPDSSMAC